MRAAAALTLLWIGAATAQERPRGASEVVLVKRAGVTAYEEVSEEFAERCRVRARVVSFGDEGAPPASEIRARWRIGPSALVVTIGQEALDALAAVPAGAAGALGQLVVPTLAFHTPPGLKGPAASPHPELLLRVLKTARPALRTVGAVYGPRSEPQMETARDAAAKVGLSLITARADDGPAAVRALRQLVDGRTHVQAIWLPGDTDVITPQVFQYALKLQLERGLPLAAATRQQVHSGALVAVDYAPRAAGRAAAELANRVLDGRTPTAEGIDVHTGARITVNAQTARRLGVDGSALARLGATVE
jgi:hypothetical protein